MGMDVRGDESLEGPIFNYARVFTWWQLTNQLHDAFNTTAKNIEAGLSIREVWARSQSPSENGESEEAAAGVEPAPDGIELQTPRSRREVPEPQNISPEDWDTERDLGGNSEETALYCGLQTDQSHRISAYPREHKGIYARMFWAMVVALIVQWGSTGSAIVIAYLTPTVGLGCRSGGYLLYGALGTAVPVLLVASMLFSQAAMQRYQDEYSTNPDADFSNEFSRTWQHSILCVLAVSFRFLGKFLAISNTLWLILSSLFEYIGVYNTCWCKSCALSLGYRGWAVLFKTDSDFKQVARGPWVGGIIMSTALCIILWLFFSAVSRHGRRQT
jgi:hypothetical protein